MSFIDDTVVVFPHELTHIHEEFYTHYNIIRRVLTFEHNSSHSIINSIPHNIINVSTKYDLISCLCNEHISDLTRVSAVQIFIPIKFIRKIRTNLTSNEHILDLDPNSDGLWIQLHKINSIDNKLNSVHINDLESINYDRESSTIYIQCNLYLECSNADISLYHLRAVLI